MDIEAIARVCHEVNRGYCLALGDTSQLPWEVAPSWQKESAITGVKFHLSNPNAGPEASHNSWMEEKLSTGWKLGPSKNSEKKEHPCLIPFRNLPIEQQAKDSIFRSIVHALGVVNV